MTVSNSYTKTGLVPFTQYDFRVIASTSYGESESNWTSITTKQDSRFDFIETSCSLQS